MQAPSGKLDPTRHLGVFRGLLAPYVYSPAELADTVDGNEHAMLTGLREAQAYGKHAQQAALP